MNWVLIVVIVILAGYTLAGFSKGFLKIIYSLVSWIVILGFVMFATPHIQDYLKNNTDIYNKVVAYCEEAIREKAEQKAESENDGALDALTESELYGIISEMLPEDLLESLQEQTSELTDELMEGYGFYNKTAVALADLFLQGVSTLVAMIAGAIVSAILSAVLGFIGKLPLIGFVNSLLGLAAGAANGLLIVWIAFYLVAVLCTTELGSDIITQIYANEFLAYLYENNLVLSLLT